MYNTQLPEVECGEHGMCEVRFCHGGRESTGVWYARHTTLASGADTTAELCIVPGAVSRCHALGYRAPGQDRLASCENILSAQASDIRPSPSFSDLSQQNAGEKVKAYSSFSGAV